MDQSFAELDKIIQLEVEIENDIYLHDFYIYERLRFDVLLGLDFCRKSNITINFDKNYDNELPSSELISDKLKSDVRLRKEYKILPKSLTKVECQLEFNIGLGYFKPDKRMKDEFFLELQESVVEATDSCYIFVYNPRPIPLTLFNNLKIGTINQIKEDDVEQNMLIIKCENNNNKITNKPFLIESQDTNKVKKVNEILEQNRDLFGDSVDQLGKAIGVEHEINLTTEVPVKLNAYKTSPKEKEIIREQVKDMLKNNIIEESQSSYSAPVVLVRKKNGKIRFCIDYRRLNDITVKDRHPLPLISDIINIMSDCKYFSVLDLLSGYWNVVVKKEDRHKTAFITPDGLFQWIVMPFGLTNSPATFQRFMQKVMEEYLYKFVVVYLDDFLIFSKSYADHIKHLNLFFERIRKFNLRLSIEKCKFLCPEAKYLGHVISYDGLKPDPDKIKAVENFPVPKKVRDVQSFLGLCNYYRSFVECYAYIADPLTKLTRKDVKFNWTNECQEAFENLKQKLITAPILAQFREQAHNEIYTDASNYGMSAILGQIHNDKHVVICYSSKMFNATQLNYSISEKECCALIYAVQKYRHYIYGSHFTVYTDHNPLKYITKIKNPNGRLMRYSMILQEYDFEVLYKPGKRHQNADTLSRYPFESPDYIDEEIRDVLLNETINIVEAQKDDEWCKRVRRAVELNLKNGHKYVIKNDILYRKTYDLNYNPILITCLPKGLRKQILRDLHDNELGGAHLGMMKTYHKVKSRFFWPNNDKTIIKYVNNCEKCQLLKEEKALEKGLMQPPGIKEPFDSVGVDIFGPITPSSKNNEYIIIMIDMFTKWLETKAVKNVQSETLAKWFCYDIIPKHGAINRILTDNASYFTSEFTEMVMKLTNSKHVTSTPYAPQTNGNAERACSVVKNMLKFYVKDNQKDWDYYLPLVTFSYNISVHKTTRYSPFYLLYFREPKLPIDVAMDLPRDFKFGEKYKQSILDCRELVRYRISESQKDNKYIYDKKHRDVEFNVGDLVSLRVPQTQTGLSKKLLCHRRGPYKIIEKHSPLNYSIQEIENPDIVERVHIRRLNKWNQEYIPELDEWGRQDKDQKENIETDQVKIVHRPGYTMDILKNQNTENKQEDEPKIRSGKSKKSNKKKKTKRRIKIL